LVILHCGAELHLRTPKRTLVRWVLALQSICLVSHQEAHTMHHIHPACIP
jgi:hypothetical protein